MDNTTEKRLLELLDKRDIEESFLNYTRGVDRQDADLIRAAFHPDAIDNHTRAVRGSIEGMLEWWLPQQPQREATQHFVTNQRIDLDGDSAHVETYFICIIKHHGADDALFAGGRYVDRFEKRQGKWKIALRVVLSEWQVEADARAMRDLPGRVLPFSTRDKGDLVYSRPLVNPPPV